MIFIPLIITQLILTALILLIFQTLPRSIQKISLNNKHYANAVVWSFTFLLAVFVTGIVSGIIIASFVTLFHHLINYQIIKFKLEEK